MSDLDARYGKHGGRRWIWPVVAVLGIGTGVAFAAWMAFQEPRPVNGVLWGYEVLDDHRVEVTLDVHRPEPLAVECTVFAQAEDHSIVGERTVAIPAGTSENTRAKALIRTERRAVNGVLRGCRPIR
jgi:hypothetical protein